MKTKNEINVRTDLPSEWMLLWTQRLTAPKTAGAKAKQDCQTGRDALQSLDRLFTSAFKGQSAVAAAQLANVTAIAVGMLDYMAYWKPELVRPWARHRQLWPSAIGVEPRGEKHALAVAKRQRVVVERVELGADTPEGMLRDANASDAEARSWATAVFLEMQRLRPLVRGNELTPLLPDHPGLSAIGLGIDLSEREELPDWASRLAKLPEQPDKSWWNVANNLIRHECPDIHERPEWANIRTEIKAKAKAGENITGKVTARILGRIRQSFFALLPPL